MPRDRIAALRQIQQIQASSSGNNYNDERPPPYNGNSDGPSNDSYVIEMERLDGDGLGAFLAKVEEIRHLLNELKQDVESVKRKQSEILSSPNTDDPKRKELDELMAKIKVASKVIRQKLKDIERAIAKEEENDEDHGAQLRIKKTQHAALLRLFMDAMNDYQLAQTDYRDRCKGRMKRQLDIAGTPLEDEEVERLMDEGNWSVFTQGIISESAQAKQMLADIEARHNDILQLEKSIRELHEMFVEMAMLVESQGEQIDRIENHVANAKEHVEKAREQTQQAVRLQSSARKKKIIIIIVVLIILLVLGLILYFSFK